MSPEVAAAVVAGALTVFGTLGAQYFGRRGTKKDAEKALAEQREQLSRTFAEQHEQLDRTLAEQRTRTMNERFASTAEQLGSDKPAVRLAGVYAMAGLADDWEEHRQTCVDVLCAYLRMPYEPDPGENAPEPQRLAFQASREARHTVIRVITAHLKEDAAVSWQGLNFDFRGAVFDGGDFSFAQFSGGSVNFIGAHFSGGTVSFVGAEFSGSTVSFNTARFSGGTVNFMAAQFSGGEVFFNFAQFSGSSIFFVAAMFSGGTVSFAGAQFSGGAVVFNAGFRDGKIRFNFAQFSGSTVQFGPIQLANEVFDLVGSHFVGSQFSGGTVTFGGAQFSGGKVTFEGAHFSGGEVDFSEASDWSLPPAFSWTGTPPPSVKLPEKEGQSQA